MTRRRPRSLVVFFVGLSALFTGFLGVLPAYATSPVGLSADNALQFDGSNDFAYVTDKNSLDLSTFTFETWVRPNGTGVEYMIWNKENSYELAIKNGDLQYALQSVSWTWISTGITITSNNTTWTHIAFVKSGSNVSIYINGSSTAAYTNSSQPITLNNSDKRLTIGGRCSSSCTDASTESLFKGTMNDVRLWNTARSASEIAATYNKRLASNLGSWFFDETSGSTAYNGAVGGGRALNLTIAGGATRTTSSLNSSSESVASSSFGAVSGILHGYSQSTSAEVTFASSSTSGGTVSITSNSGAFTFTPTACPVSSPYFEYTTSVSSFTSSATRISYSATETTRPTVSSVSSEATNGRFGLGNVIEVTITFSEVICVIGTPQLTLETGSNDRVSSYTSGSGTTTLTFAYTVQTGDVSADLDYVNINSLALNGGTIRDSAGNNATLTLPAPGTTGSLGFNKALIIDTTAPSSPPTITITETGSALRLSYNETLSSTTAARSQFTVTRAPSETMTVSSATASGSVVTLGLGGTIYAGETITVSYADPNEGGDDANAIQDLAGNDAASFINVAATNNSTQKRSQTVSFGALTPRTLGTGTFSLSASASSGLPVTFSSTTASRCTVTDTTVNLISAGTCSITASQSGNTTFSAASTVTQSFLISETLTVSTPSGASLSGTFGSAFSLTLIPSGGSGDNSFTLVGTLPAGLSLTDRGETATIAGTPTATGSSSIQVQVTDSNGATSTTGSFSIVINRATQSITFSLGMTGDLRGGSGNFGTYPYSSQFSGISTSGFFGTGEISYAISNGTSSGCSLSDTRSATATITASSFGTCFITATIGADANYESATSVAAVFTFEQAAQAPLIITTLTVAYGETLILQTSGGNGDGVISFGSVSGDCTVLGSTLTPIEVGSCFVTANKASDDNYLAQSSTSTEITITTGSATAAISFTSASFTFGVTNSITVATSVAGKVRFLANNKVIKNCKARSTTLIGPFTATCSYRPDTRRALTITAVLTPTDTRFATRTSTSNTFLVARRAGSRS